MILTCLHVLKVLKVRPLAVFTLEDGQMTNDYFGQTSRLRQTSRLVRKLEENDFDVKVVKFCQSICSSSSVITASDRVTYSNL